MKTSLLAPFAMLAVAAFAPATFAQGGGTPTRVATADTGKIFQALQELKDYKEDMEAERLRITGMDKEKRDELTKLQNDRNNVKVDTPQWEELNNKLMDAFGEYQLWGQSVKAKGDRNQKRQVKQMFTHIEQACAEIAKRDGYDLVLADQRGAAELPDNLDTITMDELQRRIGLRQVLYSAPKNDISNAVIQIVDEKYKSTSNGSRPRPLTGSTKKTDGGTSGSTTTPPPAPAPARNPAPRPPAK